MFTFRFLIFVVPAVEMEFQNEIALLHSVKMRFQSEITLLHRVEIEFQSEIALLHCVEWNFNIIRRLFKTESHQQARRIPFRPNENPLPATAGHHSDAQNAA